jgi:hypothetical protein
MQIVGLCEHIRWGHAGTELLALKFSKTDYQRVAAGLARFREDTCCDILPSLGWRDLSNPGKFDLASHFNPNSEVGA